jgi:hypothetical protein
MGVKDTFYAFNIPEFEFKDYLENTELNEPIKEIPYTLAHNIIFSGYEFALEIGLDACNDFIKTTQFLLEEDNDDIELIDIECGKDGIPLVFNGKFNEKEAKRVYNKLCETIGKDNFIFEEIEDEFDDELEDDEDFDEFMNDIWNIEPDEFEEFLYREPLKERFEDIKKLKAYDNMDEGASEEFSDVINRLFYNHYGYEKVDESRERIFNFFDIDVDNQIMPGEVLGFNKDLHPDKYHVTEKFLTSGIEKSDLLSLIGENPEIPFFKYMHIMQMELIAQQNEELDEDTGGINPDLVETLLDGYITMHPNYQLLRLIKEAYLIRNEKPSEIIEKLHYNHEPLSDLFINRTHIHSVELTAVVNGLFESFVAKDNYLDIDSLVNFIQKNYPSLGAHVNHILMTNLIFKSQLCRDHYLKS